MATLLVELEARDTARNLHRAYRIEAGLDLFGMWQVDLAYGRIGRRHRILKLVTAEEATARRLVLGALRRRSSAPKRIGVPYVVTGGFDSLGWLNSSGGSDHGGTVVDKPFLVSKAHTFLDGPVLFAAARPPTAIPLPSTQPSFLITF
jgi:hypothetical protein